MFKKDNSVSDYVKKTDKTLPKILTTDEKEWEKEVIKMRQEVGQRVKEKSKEFSFELKDGWD